MDTLLILVIYLMIGQSGIAPDVTASMNGVPSEPDFSSPDYVDWNILSGHAPFIQSFFNLDHDGKPEFYTLRRIISTDGVKGSREEVLTQIDDIQRNNPNSQAFFAQSGIGEDQYIVYLAERYPLFYCLSNVTWIDKEEDGVNGNEEVYERPGLKTERSI
ncbi:MAG TPA: hypothetical protein VI584_02495 [Nitrospiria bacterium]|nr:hypothetical protein [Nitrospiria bacterium]